MESRKLEIICKAWGHNIPNGGIDENGWSKESCTYGTFDVIKYDQQHYLEGAYIRPKSLKGIENNNGWISINSVEDLPSKDGEYYVVKKFGGGIITMQSYGNIKEMENVSKSWLWNYTHYQEVVRPSPPIY